MLLRMLLLLTCLVPLVSAQGFRPSGATPPPLAREFRGAWSACIYNLDWPSRSGLSAAQQQAELKALIEKMSRLNLNALIFQVRPQCDAVYSSSIEPWTPWLVGRMGQSPGYDPLSVAIREAHRRGIEVHAWFNPFRALSNVSSFASPNHLSHAAPELTRRYGSLLWCDPAKAATRQRALRVMLDVLQRYDVDGIHIDDYFYPYPQAGKVFPDGKTTAERRAIVDDFVAQLYREVKQVKPWARVGISPFGIWQPGVPAGTTASLNAYEHLACDARKWLQRGWCDYLAPQLYWRIEGPQSFPLLLNWWREQGSRPVWPGIASARVMSSEDPGRRSGEIVQQVKMSRVANKGAAGHVHWSMRSLIENRDALATKLAAVYPEPALVPAMPWISTKPPAAPRVTVVGRDGAWRLQWQSNDQRTVKVAVQARTQQRWRTLGIVGVSTAEFALASADAVAVTAVDRYGNVSAPVVLQR